MSALRHGLYRHGFMLCDRCVWNGDCGGFEAGGDCRFEREAFYEIVQGLTEEYGLDGVADRILVERAAMYLIRLARAEAYEAWMGDPDRAAAWGSYVVRLDRALRELLKELAVTRAARLKMRAEDVLTVGLDELIDRVVGKAGRRRARGRRARLPGAEPFREAPSPAEVYRRVRRDRRRGVG
jgi:hypothetical protein